MKTGVKVSDVLTRDPLIISPEDSIKKAALIMEKDRISSLIVMDKRELKGIIKGQDIIRRVVAAGLSYDIKIKNIMSTDLTTINPDSDLYDALVLMRDKKINQLIVMEEGNLAGLLTVKDVLKIQPGLFDLLTEKFRLRKDMPDHAFGDRYVEGECENCGNFDQLFEINGKWVCSDCR